MAAALIRNLDTPENFTVLATALSDGDTDAGDTIEISGDWTSTTDETPAEVEDNNITIRGKAGDEARHAGVDNAGSNYELAIDGDVPAHCIIVSFNPLYSIITFLLELFLCSFIVAHVQFDGS